MEEYDLQWRAEFCDADAHELKMGLWGGLMGIWTILSFVIYLFYTLIVTGTFEFFGGDGNRGSIIDGGEYEARRIELGELIKTSVPHENWRKKKGKLGNTETGMVLVVVARSHADSNVPSSTSEEPLHEVVLKICAPPCFTQKQILATVVGNIAFGLLRESVDEDIADRSAVIEQKTRQTDSTTTMINTGDLESGTENGGDTREAMESGVLTPAAALAWPLIKRLRDEGFEFTVLRNAQISEKL